MRAQATKPPVLEPSCKLLGSKAGGMLQALSAALRGPLDWPEFSY